MKDLLARDTFMGALNNPQLKDKVQRKRTSHNCDKHSPMSWNWGPSV